MCMAELSRTFEAISCVMFIHHFCVHMWLVRQQSVQDESPHVSMLWGLKEVPGTLLSPVVIQVMLNLQACLQLHKNDKARVQLRETFAGSQRSP